MSREKQIEKMAKALRRYECFGNCQPCAKCWAYPMAEMLYNEGYRKQSEGEWKLGKSGCMYFCSCCGHVAHPREEEEWNYCPNCGRPMKGQKGKNHERNGRRI